MSEAIAVSKALAPAQLVARIKTLSGTGSGLDADLIHGLQPDGSVIAVTGIIGVPGYNSGLPAGKFQGCRYPTAFLGV